MPLKSIRASLKIAADSMLSKIQLGTNILSSEILGSEIAKMFQSINFGIPLPTKLQSIECKKK